MFEHLQCVSIIMLMEFPIEITQRCLKIETAAAIRIR